MIFQHTWQKVLNGSKTQTRRIIKPDQCLSSSSLYEPYSAVVQRLQGYNWKDVYRVGVDYAVQPGRGKPAVARIRITDIRREDVRDISFEDAKAEGFASATHFLLVWTQMHDSKIYNRYPTTGQISLALEQCVIQERPVERYTAWALTFELVQP